MKTAFSTIEKRSFLTQSIDYSFSIDWSCSISANESFTVIETLTSAGIRAGPLCLMDLEINTTSFYFCFFTNTHSTELISKQYFKALSSCWTLASREQKKLNRGPTWTEVCYVLLVGWFLKIMSALVSNLGSLISAHPWQNLDGQGFGHTSKRHLQAWFTEFPWVQWDLGQHAGNKSSKKQHPRENSLPVHQGPVFSLWCCSPVSGKKDHFMGKTENQIIMLYKQTFTML